MSSELFLKYIENLENLSIVCSVFTEELNLNEDDSLEFYNKVLEDGIDFNDLLSIIDEDFYRCSIVNVIMEQTTTQELKRKVEIERNRQRLGVQFRKTSGDTPEQAINKSAQSLATHKITSTGKFEQRKKKGKVDEIKSSLQKRRLDFLSASAKIRSDKASQRRKAEAKAGSTKGASKFVSRLKAA